MKYRDGLIALLGACLLALVAAPPALAQDGVLTGTVLDADTGEPLPLANVVIEETGQGTSTEPDGTYRMTDLEPGTYTVVASYVGYQSAQVDVVLEAGAEEHVTIELIPEGLEVGELTVEAIRDDRDPRGLGAARLDAEEVRALPAVLEPDIFRSLQLLPGVQAASDFSSGLYIRGGSPDQTLVTLDGAPIYNPTHVFGFFSAFNPDAIDDVQLFKSDFPASYGGRLGSVVDLRTRGGSAEETTGGASLGLLASRAHVSGGGERGTYMVSARRSTLEPVLAALDDVDDVPDSFAFYDINATATFNLSSRDRLSVSGYMARDGLNLQLLSDTEFDVRYGNRAFTASWQHLFSDRLFTTLRATASHYDSTPDAQLGGTTLERDSDVYDVSASGDVYWDVTEEHALEGGLRVGNFTTSLRNTFDGEDGFSPRTQTSYGAAYIENTYRPTSQWRLRTGLRANYYSAGGQLRLAPRLSAEYQPTESVRLQAGYGRHFQYLTLVSTELFSAFDFWLTTDDGVDPAYSDQFTVGVKTTPLESWEFDVELYYRELRDLFELDQRIVDPEGIPYEETLLFGEGYAAGAEVLLRRNEGRINGFVGYTLGRTERRFDEFEGGQYYTPRHDRTHDLTAVLNVDLNDSWRATGVFTYATGQAYTEPDRQYKMLDSPFSSSPLDTFVSEFNAERLPAYHRLDVGVRRIGPFFGVGSYELQLQLINAYARDNTWFYFFETEEDNTINREAVSQIPVPVPNISFTVNF